MTERRRFIATASGVVAAAAAGAIVDAPNVIAQPKVQWRLSTAWPTSLDVPVLRELKKLSVEVIREQFEKTPMARKVHASFTRFQAVVNLWDNIAEGAYRQLVAG